MYMLIGHPIEYANCAGALTKGDRRAASGADLTEFNFDTPYGRTALRTMYTAICRRELVPGIALSAVAAAGQEFADFNAELHVCINLFNTICFM